MTDTTSPQPDPSSNGNGQSSADPPPDTPIQDGCIRNRPAANPTPDRHFKRPTCEEMEQYITEVGEWLVAGFAIWQIHKAGKLKYGWSWKTANRYVFRARHRAATLLNATKPGEMVAEQWEKLNKILREHSTSGIVCIAAIREQNALMGLHKPLKVAQTTAEGKDLYTAAIDLLSDDDLKQIDLIGRKLEGIVAKQKRLESSGVSGGSNGHVIDVVPVKRDEGEGEGEEL